MNIYKQMIWEKENHIRIFKKLVKLDTKVQKQIRNLWLENQLDYIDFDDYYGSAKEKKIIEKAKKLTPIQLANYMVDYYDAPLDIFSKKSLKNLSARDREFVLENQ